VGVIQVETQEEIQGVILVGILEVILVITQLLTILILTALAETLGGILETTLLRITLTLEETPTIIQTQVVTTPQQTIPIIMVAQTTTEVAITMVVITIILVPMIKTRLIMAYRLVSL
jgi:hypothetical protein